jgi:anti-anti-sigma regulatory factor
MNPTQILIAVAETTVYLKPVGRANIHVSASFKSAAAELQNRGFRRFILDLSECEMMDSTFLGLISAWASQGREPGGRERPLLIELRNPNARILTLLEDLGVKHLFNIGETEKPSVHYQTAPAPSVSREALSQTSLEAHQTLMAIHPANIPKFKDVVAFLKDDLTRLHAPLEDGPRS